VTKRWHALERVHPLNTLSLLKGSSESLDLSPEEALTVAQDLYRCALTSYPRTESRVYPPDFNCEQIVQRIAHGPYGAIEPHQDTKAFARKLLESGLAPPRGDGENHGDHSPITPVFEDLDEESDDEEEAYNLDSVHCMEGNHSTIQVDSLRPDRRRVLKKQYDFICRAFLASVSPDGDLLESTLTMETSDGTSLVSRHSLLQNPGWHEVFPISVIPDYNDMPDIALQSFLLGATFCFQQFSVTPEISQAPYLTESAMLDQQLEHGIGTDATMAGHIAKNVSLKYLSVHVSSRTPRDGSPPGWNLTTRELHVTILGSSVCRWFMRVDRHLALPLVRARVEEQCVAIKEGRAAAATVLETERLKFLAMFRTAFDPENPTLRNMLIDFLRLPLQTLEVDAEWQRAGRQIAEADLQEMSANRAEWQQRLRGRAAAEIPEPASTQCVMPNAHVCSVERQMVQVINSAGKLLLNATETNKLASTVRVVSSTVFDACKRPVTSLVLRSHLQVERVLNVTSHHKVLSKSLTWQPFFADSLQQNDIVLASEFPEINPLQLSLSECMKREVKIAAVGIETDYPDDAFWLACDPAIACSSCQPAWLRLGWQCSECNNIGQWALAGDSGLLAIFGETAAPRVLDRQVSIWSFKRCPEAFRLALAKSDELGLSRRALRNAGFNPDIPIEMEGLAKIFVTPQDARLIMHMRRAHAFPLLASEVVVGFEHEEALRTVIAQLPSAAKVKCTFLRRLDLLSQVRNAGQHPIAYPILSHAGHLTSQNTFLHFPTPHEETGSTRSRSSTQ